MKGHKSQQLKPDQRGNLTFETIRAAADLLEVQRSRWSARRGIRRIGKNHNSDKNYGLRLFSKRDCTTGANKCRHIGSTFFVRISLHHETSGISKTLTQDWAKTLWQRRESRSSRRGRRFSRWRRRNSWSRLRHSWKQGGERERQKTERQTREIQYKLGYMYRSVPASQYI